MTDVAQNIEACLYSAPDQGWLKFTHPVAVFATQRVEEVPALLQEVEATRAQRGGWAVGMVSYEAAPAFDAALPVQPAHHFPLLWFALFDSVERLTDLPAAESSTAVTWCPDLAPEQYAQAVARIRQHIAEGDSYQVNFSFRLHAEMTHDPWQFFLQLSDVNRQAHRPAYGAYIDTGEWAICSTSPELFFSKTGNTLISCPMKGTQPRGLSYADDQQRAVWLQQSEKNRAENVMIVDMVRNDMGRIARSGSVTVPQLFALEQYPTVWQMTSTVRAETDASITAIFGALFPPASITGAPKRQAMQIIRTLETSPRNIYTGSIGLIGPESSQFNVAIRTVALHKPTARAEYGVGSGIVWDSEMADEYQECLHKTAVLTQVRGDFRLLESLLWSPQEGLFLAEHHLRRLQQSAEYFGWNIDLAGIAQQLQRCITHLPAQAHKLRLLVAADGSSEVTAAPLVPLPSIYRLGLATMPVDQGNVFLYHKTTQRSHYQHAVAAHTYDDVLLWNTRGEVTESCIANLLYEWEGQWYTPPVSSGLLPGVYRAALLEEGQVRERVLHKDELKHCDRLRLANSVRKCWDVESLGADGVPHETIGHDQDDRHEPQE